LDQVLQSSAGSSHQSSELQCALPGSAWLGYCDRLN
jgi:hypothetical protein